MDKKVIKSFAFNMAYQVLILLLPVITTPYVSRCLGVDNVGIFSFTSSIVSYFVLFITFGFHVYGQKEIAKKQHDVTACSQLFFEIQIRKLIVTLLVMLVFVGFVFIQKKYTVVYIIQAISLIAVFFDISYLYQGLELYNITVIRNGIIKLIGVVCTFVFVRNSSDLNKYILITCLITLLGNVSLWINLDKFISFRNFKSFSLLKDIRFIFELFIPFISIQLYFNIDKTMLGILFETPTENGYYEQANKIIRICSTIITAIGAVLVSSISRMISENNQDKIKETIQDSIRLGLFIASPMVFGLLGVADIFVPIFFGEGYDKASFIIMILSPILLFTAISNTIGNGILVTTNRHNYVSIAAALGAVINILFNIIMIPRMYSVGAAIASVMAEMIVLVVQWFFARDYVKTGSIFQYLFKYILAGIIMLAPLIALKLLFANRIDRFPLICILIGGGVISYLLVLLLEKDPIIIAIKNKTNFKRKIRET